MRYGTEADKMFEVLLGGGTFFNSRDRREPFFRMMAEDKVHQAFRDKMKEVTAEKLDLVRPEILLGECNTATRKSVYRMKHDGNKRRSEVPDVRAEESDG